jgi:hypothetical protein
MSMFRPCALRTGLAAMVASALAGCSAPLSGIAPVKPPEYPAILAEYNELRNQWPDIAQGTADQTTIRRFVSHGYDLADQACVLYFTRLRQLRNETNFATTTLTSLFAASGVITALSGGTFGAVAGLFTATGLVPSTVQSFNNIYLLAEVSDDLYPAVYQAMAAARAAHPADGSQAVGADGTPLAPQPTLTPWNAGQLVRQYATLCTLPALSATVNKGVSNTKLDLDVTTGITAVKKAPAAQ